MRNGLLLHFLETILDAIDTDLRLIGELHDHRVGGIVVMSNHDDQLRSRWFVLTSREVDDGRAKTN